MVFPSPSQRRGEAERLGLICRCDVITRREMLLNVVRLALNDSDLNSQSTECLKALHET